MKSALRFLLVLFCSWFSVGFSLASTIDLSVARQLKLTITQKLPNSAVFIEREIPGSDIAFLSVSIKQGQADLPESRRALNGLTFDTMEMASTEFSKEKIFSMTEQYAINLNCSGGIELSGCQFETISEHFDQGLALLTSIMNQPSFNPVDMELSKKRRVAEFQSEEQSPDQHVNALVNQVYYPANHPYRLIPKDAMNQLPTFSTKDLHAYYASLKNANDLQIVYVGPKLSPARLSKIQAAFSSWKPGAKAPREVLPPTFDAKFRSQFEHRPIPTAYIRAKFNAPGAASTDSATSKVLFEILSETLHEEVRTKRSLSYAIGGMTLQMQQGIGVLVASTSKPKETIETIAGVLKSCRDTVYKPEKLAEYKNVFTTSHYLTLETHASLANALSSAQLYLGDATKLYEFPAKIAAVTPEDIKKLAGEILRQIRVGVIYDNEKFKQEWFEPLFTL